MAKKILSSLFIVGTVFGLAACGNAPHDELPENQPSQTQATPSKSAETSYRSVFQHSVFLGDSITEGLSYHDLLDDANVQAGAGKITEVALDDVNKIAKRNPKHIFIQLGSDDILLPPKVTDNPKQYSLAYYAKLIDKIEEKLPGANITVLSVTPVTPDAEKKEPRYKNISDYNQGLKKLAAEKKVGYADLSPIFAKHKNLHDSDGIHFKEEFYTFMLELLKDRVK